MSNSHQNKVISVKSIRVGVSGYAASNDIYEPKRHTHKTPIRAGSTDALNVPSLDYTGERKPYWGNKE